MFIDNMTKAEETEAQQLANDITGYFHKKDVDTDIGIAALLAVVAAQGVGESIELEDLIEELAALYERVKLKHELAEHGAAYAGPGEAPRRAAEGDRPDPDGEPEEAG